MSSVQDDSWEHVARERARLLQRNLASLRAWVDKAGFDDAAEAEQTFELLAKSSLALLDEITFRDLPLARLLDQADLVLHVEGDAAAGVVRASLVSRFLTGMQRSLARVMRQLALDVKVDGQGAVDLGFLGTAPGSLYIGFALPRPEDMGLLPGVMGADSIALAGRALKLLSAGTLAAAEDASFDRLAQEVPDPRVRDAVLLAVNELAPTKASGVSLVELSGRAGAVAAMTPGTRKQSAVLLKESAARAKIRATYVGVVREIDLDLKRFELRGVDNIRTLRCAYDMPDEGVPKTWVDRRVIVQGLVEQDRQGQPAMMWATDIEIVPDDERAN